MTTTHKNLYENLIQDMIINGIDGMTPELRAMIDSAPVEKKRSMILTIMEENNPEHRLLCSKIQKVVSDNKTGETQHIASIVKMLREYVKVSDTEVKTMGEVMTPIELVEEMLDTLPYEVWTNPNLKWLDPCNGVGTFISVAVKRLMKGLENFQPDAELRYRHIMENMIYTCELQAKNVFLYMYAFDPKDEFALNVFCGSYLSEEFNTHMAEFWGVEKFDVIVMNPPYNSSTSQGGSGHVLWDKFVIKTINQLVDSGYLVAVHPNGWRNPSGAFKKIQNFLKERQMQYLNMNSHDIGYKVFGAKTPFDYYCLRNVLNIKVLTKIVDFDDKSVRIDISELPFIPNCNIQEVLSLVAKKGEETVNLLHTCKYHVQNECMSKESNNEFKYPCIANVNNADKPNCIWYSNVNNNGHFGISKVIFGRNNCGVLVDKNGEYGMTYDCRAIIDEPENLPFIQKALKNEYFIKNIMGFRVGNGDKYNSKMIATFRKDFWKEFLY